MFIHIGSDEVVLKKDVIMILDKYAVVSKATSEFLQVAREEGFFQGEDGRDKKSIIICDKKIFFSPISSVTLLKRSNFLKNFNKY
ncbi:MAG: extracellular matrix regulatory protein [Tepidanaerobacteraceae bacterium]|nr:extracellular matrix regulatory protein [Tepidanaerobacteraceae bacterium]